MYHLPKNMINTVTALIFITSPFHWQISPGFPGPNFTAGLDHKDLGDFSRSQEAKSKFLYVPFRNPWFFTCNFGR